ncbi:MAG: hypothetical protein H7328_05555 [Bdellovibrio sp.]|nr:hypothetical protein [Bdellovibrio sp.]
MKTKLNHVFAALLTTFLISHAQADSFLFLTYEEIQTLTPAEKKAYINSVKQISNDFDDSISALKSQNAKWSFLFDGLKTKVVHAAEPIGDNIHERSPNDIRMENAKISYVIARSQMLARITTYSGPGTKQYAKELYDDSYERLQLLSKRQLSDEERKNFVKNLNALREAQTDVAKIDPRILKYDHSLDNLISNFGSNKKSKKQEEVEIETEYKAKPSATLAPPPLPTQDTMRPAPIEGKYKESKMITESRPSPSCIYAGFIIQKAKCSPPTSLPTGFSLKEISSSDFRCGKPGGTVMCNPLLFGYKNSGTAYCLEPAVNASAECSHLSDNTENIKRLLALWGNPENKKVIEQYQSDLNQLCDSKTQTSPDVLKTCKVIQAHFNSKAQAELIIASHDRMKQQQKGSAALPSLPSTRSKN